MHPRILVVEDDEDMRDSIVDTLEDAGYQVGAAASGAEALALAGRSGFGLIITDVRMAGMDGIETLARLRREHPYMRSIVITGYASDDAPTRAIQAEAWDYIYKPFGRDDLLRAVERVKNADSDRNKTTTLIDALTSGYQKLKDTAAAVVTDIQLASVEQVRTQAFQSFYVGVRSRKLASASALYVWERLEAAERERQALKEGGLHLQERQSVVDAYQYVVDLLGAISRDSLAVANPSRTSHIDRQAFQAFFRGIQEGRIGAHELTLAAFVRYMDAFAMERSSDLREHYRAFWGDPAA
ncbi:MAG: response regulator [Armatimonadetes bacterium]|nr:response regulator [Armatimonadota bacterium]